MVLALPPVALELPVHRIATQEAVSLETRLALVARRREQLDTAILERLANLTGDATPDAPGLVINKNA